MERFGKYGTVWFEVVLSPDGENPLSKKFCSGGACMGLMPAKDGGVPGENWCSLVLAGTIGGVPGVPGLEASKNLSSMETGSVGKVEPEESLFGVIPPGDGMLC